MSVAFKNERKEKIETEIDSVIRLFLGANTKRGEEPLSNTFSVFSNYLRMIVRKKLISPNYVLSSIVKWSKTHIGLFLIGMVVREGANPNIYLTYPGKGNLHILAWASAVRGPGDPLFNYISTVLRMLGSDIFRPALRFEGDSSDVDVRLIEQSFESLQVDESYYYRAGMLVKDYVSQNGYIYDKTVTSFLNSMEDEWLLDVLVATDDIGRFNSVSSKDARKNKWDYIQSILDSKISLTRFIIDLSTAHSMNIILSMDEERYPLIRETINGQSVPLFAASASCDKDFFDIFMKKGSSVKYVTINTIITFFKIFKENDIKLSEDCFNMLNNAVKIGADIDLYQFNFFVSIADYDQIEKIRNSYQTPKWKKLCSIKNNLENRPELRQIAFNLNLDYSMSDEKICKKLEQIATIGTEQYFESAVKRQEDRISLEVEDPVDEYIDDDFSMETEDVEKSVIQKTRPRCSEKTLIVNNPYAYNDARMAFYKDHKDGEIWCFTSDTFASLISSKVNPYNGNPLPAKFIATIKAHLNTLKEIGVYETNETIKDSLKEIYSRSVINNKKTESQYDTVMKVLSLYGVSQERFESLRTETLQNTILESIADVNILNFKTLPMVLKQRTTTRIIYSMAKKDTPLARESGEITDDLSGELFESISRAISGDSPVLKNYTDVDAPGEGNIQDEYMNIFGRNV